MWDKFTSALLFVFYKKEAKLMPPGVLLSRKKSPKWLFFVRGTAPDPAGEAYSAPQTS